MEIYVNPHRFGSFGAIVVQQIYAEPADTNNNIANPTLIPTAALTAQAGDLLLIHVRNRKDSGTANSTFALNPGAQGGQSWTKIFENQANFVANAWFMATFNGVWSSVNIEAQVFNDNVSPVPRLTVFMLVVRPTSPVNVWAIDVPCSNVITTPTGGANTCNIPGVTVAANSFTIGYWVSGAPQTYTNLVGAGWAVLGTAQYRNGVSQSNSYAIKFNNGAGGATGDVSKDQLTNGAYLRGILSFKET